jgi:hypothetical protein
MKPKALLVFASLLILPAQTASANEISAIVEQVGGPDSGVHEMDLLKQGQVIKLKTGASMTVGYLRSCVREIIVGGQVTIGAEASKVVNGLRRKEDVDCDGGQLVRTSKQSDDVAGAVFRKGNFDQKALPKPDWTLFGVSPFVRLSKAGGTLKIERLDKVENTIKVPIKGDWVDLKTKGIKLKPSGVYAMTSGKRPVVVKVSPLAEPGAPILSRLIVM